MRRYLPEGMLCTDKENMAKMKTLDTLRQAMENGDILEARAVVCDAKHNLTVEMGDFTGLIPREETAIGIKSGTTREIAIISRVGKPVCFRITSIEEKQGKPEILLSRRLAQEEAQEMLMNRARPGDIIPACITHIEPFGAFVDVGCGVVSLIGIENISVSRIRHPSERFFEGQFIYAVILSKDTALRRISLSHRELLGTWEQNACGFSPGETVSGVVRSVEDYGIFVELTPNLSGLAEKKEGIREGDHVSVYIKSISKERMKIKLSIIDVIAQNTPMTPLHYFETSGHMARFVYTPEECVNKKIETVF